jgi:hypothetical protein
MIRRAIPILIFATVAAAQTFERGDVLATSTNHGLFSVTSTLRLYDSSGVFQRDISTRSGADGYGDTLVDRQSVLWVTGGNAVFRLDATGSVVGTSPGPAAARYFSPSAISNIIVAGNIGSTLYILGSNGGLIRTFDVGTTVTGIDLSVDQCTIFYGSGTDIRRYDFCRGQSLGVFASLPAVPRVNALRVLGDGTLLAATLSAVFRFSPSGSIVQTYPLGSFALALDVDGASFWVGNGTNILKIDIATGNALIGPIDTGDLVDAISVVGEPRVAVSPAAIAAVPTLSSTLLLVMVGISVAIAAVRLSA